MYLFLAVPWIGLWHVVVASFWPYEELHYVTDSYVSDSDQHFNKAHRYFNIYTYGYLQYIYKIYLIQHVRYIQMYTSYSSKGLMASALKNQ